MLPFIPFILPYKIDRRFGRVPWLTISVIVVTVAAFLATMSDIDGAVRVAGFRMGTQGLLWGWFTAMFLHAGLEHIGSNMFFLWLFGSYIEDVLGWKAWLVTYVVGGFAAAVTHGVLTTIFDIGHIAVPSLGASGALAAIMGLFMVRFYKTKMKFAMCWPIFPFWKWSTFAWSSLLGIGLWFAQEVGSGVYATSIGGDGVGHWAHVGGLVFGAAVGLLSGQRQEADAMYLTEEAIDAATTGDMETAAAKYEQLGERAAADPELLLGKAKTELASGADVRVVAEDLRHAAELLLRAGRPERLLLALDEMRPALPAVPLDAKTLSACAGAAESKQRPDLASELYWRLVGEHAGGREAERALFRLAHIYHAAGMANEARQVWSRYRAEFPQSEWLPYADPVLAAAG